MRPDWSGLPDSTETIVGVVDELGKKPADIRPILLTHAHSDHMGSDAVLKKLTGAEVYIS